MQNDRNPFYKPTKFSSNENGIENYQTAAQEIIAYKSIFHGDGLNGELDNKARSSSVQRKKNPLRNFAPKLKPGEFAVVERKYSRVGMFDFVSRTNKINSAEDVAFIFRQLESEAVEHAFAVYIDKDTLPSVQWLSMGGINATVIDPRTMVDAAQRLRAQEIYLVHNHPSGSLIPSRPDMAILEKLKKGFAPMGIAVNGIIINLNSGTYLIFDESGTITEGKGVTASEIEGSERVGVFCFNKQSFLESPTNTKIQSPSDVARFLSQQRFSSGTKTGYLLLSMSNEVVGNFFATQSERNKAYHELAGLVSRFGAVNVIAYTNKADLGFYQDLKADLHHLEINLHDVIECESSEFVRQTFEKYKSLAQEGLLNENETNYLINKSTNMQTKYPMTEEAFNDQNQEVGANEEIYFKKNLNYLNNQIKYLGFGEGFQGNLIEALQSGNEKIDFPISREFLSPGTEEKSTPVDFVLHLNKGKENSMYFLNSYSAQLKNGDNTIMQPQIFYINQGRGFTAKEAFNLLSGRTVNKDLTNSKGETYNAWVKLKPIEVGTQKQNRDFQIFNEKYGFDLKETLSWYPIREMEAPEAAEKLIASLKKGNRQPVIFNENGYDVPKFIEANPQYKNLTIYHEDGKKQFISHDKSERKNAINPQLPGEQAVKENTSSKIKR